jgi:hypothetical protein
MNSLAMGLIAVSRAPAGLRQLRSSALDPSLMGHATKRINDGFENWTLQR